MVITDQYGISCISTGLRYQIVEGFNLKTKIGLPTVKTTIAVVAVNIVWPCPSGRSWTDCRARAKAIAPRSPAHTQNSDNLVISEKEIQVISNFYSSYHYTKVLFDALQVSVDGQVEPNWPNMRKKKHLQPYMKMERVHIQVK